MAVYKFYGAKVQAPANVGSATTVGNAKLVYITNVGSTVRLVTLANAADATLATFSVVGGDTLVIAKESTDQLFAAHTEIEFNSVQHIEPNAFCSIQN